LMPKEQEGSRH